MITLRTGRLLFLFLVVANVCIVAWDMAHPGWLTHPGHPDPNGYFVR